MMLPRFDRGGLTLVVLATLVAAEFGMPREGTAQCSVLDRHPCTPYFCGIHSPPGCMPEIFYPLGQDLRVRLDAANTAPQPPDRDRPLEQLDEIGPVLSRCLQLPPPDVARPGMRVTMRLGFSKAGTVLGAPRFTYITHEAPDAVRAAYRSAATDMLDRCQPLPLTAGLGGAIAGRPFIISIIDDRIDDRKDTKDDIHEH